MSYFSKEIKAQLKKGIQNKTQNKLKIRSQRTWDSAAAIGPIFSLRTQFLIFLSKTDVEIK